MATSASDNEAVADEVEVVQFRLGGDHYAVHVDETDSIIKPKATTRVPRSADAVEGVMDYRGEVAVVINLYDVLGIDEPESIEDEHGRSQRRVIILDDSTDNQTVGLLTESIVGVQEHPEAALQTDFESVQSNVVERDLIEGVFAFSEEDEDGNEQTSTVELIDIGEVLRHIREESRLEIQQTK